MTSTRDTVLADPPIDRAGERSAEILERQARRESATRSYPRRLPIALASGSGVHVTDVDGRTYVDCLAGAGALALGHHHPVVDNAIRRAMDDGVPLTTLDLTTPIKDDFTSVLASVVPPHLADGRILFCGPTGADAIEAAVKIARTATGRSSLVAFGGGYHGMTQGALALTGARDAKEALGPLGGDVQHLPYPAGYRCPFGAPGEESAARCAAALDWALADSHSGITTPAALVIEPVQGEGGVHAAPRSFGQAVRRSADAAGVLVIGDEVQTGLGRTGALWGSDRIDLRPDLLVLSKAIGGGLPLSVVVIRDGLDVMAPGAHAGTFRGNQLALAAGAATIRHVVSERLDLHAAAMGDRLTRGLRDAAGTDRRVGDVRGPGLMVGVELVDPDAPEWWGAAQPDGGLARRVQQEMLARGVIVEVGGRHDAVVRFLPPLVIDEPVVDRVAEAFGEALAATA